MPLAGPHNIMILTEAVEPKKAKHFETKGLSISQREGPHRVVQEAERGGADGRPRLVGSNRNRFLR